jgi:hypothetical protein
MTCRHPKRARIVICADVAGNMIWLSEHDANVPFSFYPAAYWCRDCGALGTWTGRTNRMRWRKVGCP